jgi:hypothetical protein
MGYGRGRGRFTISSNYDSKNKEPRTIDPAWVLIPGNTYQIKDKLKELGCKFGEQGGKKGWYSKLDNNTEEIKALVDTLPPELDRSNWVAITGKTFDVKDALKYGFGARWNTDKKAWLVDPTKAKDAQDMVNYAAAWYPSQPERLSDVNETPH